MDVEQLIFDLFHRGIHFGAHTVDGHAFTRREQIDRLCLRRRNTTCAEKVIEQQQMVRRVIRRELCYVLPDDVEYLLNVDFRLLVGLVSGAGNCRPAAVRKDDHLDLRRMSVGWHDLPEFACRIGQCLDEQRQRVDGLLVCSYRDDHGVAGVPGQVGGA